MTRLLHLFLLFFITTNLFAQTSLLQSGPMVGYSDIKEVALWVQATEAAEVKIVYWEKGKPNKSLEPNCGENPLVKMN